MSGVNRLLVGPRPCLGQFNTDQINDGLEEFPCLGCHGAPENRPLRGASKPASEHDVNSHDRTRLEVGKSHVGPNSFSLR